MVEFHKYVVDVTLVYFVLCGLIWACWFLFPYELINRDWKLSSSSFFLFSSSNRCFLLFDCRSDLRSCLVLYIDEHVQREIMNHWSLKHPYIIRFKEVSCIPFLLDNEM